MRPSDLDVTMPKPAAFEMTPHPEVTIRPNAPAAVMSLWNDRDTIRRTRLEQLYQYIQHRAVPTSEFRKPRAGPHRSASASAVCTPQLRRPVIGQITDVEHFEAVQIIDGTNALIRTAKNLQDESRPEADVWLSGYSTAGWVDGDYLTGYLPVTITGTKQYTTVLGAPRTVYVGERFDWSVWLLPTTAKPG